jgi:hypothetical protein
MVQGTGKLGYWQADKTQNVGASLLAKIIENLRQQAGSYKGFPAQWIIWD